MILSCNTLISNSRALSHGRRVWVGPEDDIRGGRGTAAAGARADPPRAEGALHRPVLCARPRLQLHRRRGRHGPPLMSGSPGKRKTE